MGNNEEILSKIKENRAIRNSVEKNIQECYDTLEQRKTSIKNLIKYSLIFSAFVIINTGVNVAFFTASTPFVVATTTTVLTAVYGIVGYKDFKFICDNRNDEIYESIYQLKKNILDLDNKYIEYENSLAVSYKYSKVKENSNTTNIEIIQLNKAFDKQEQEIMQEEKNNSEIINEENKVEDLICQTEESKLEEVNENIVEEQKVDVLEIDEKEQSEKEEVNDNVEVIEEQKVEVLENEKTEESVESIQEEIEEYSCIPSIEQITESTQDEKIEDNSEYENIVETQENLVINDEITEETELNIEPAKLSFIDKIKNKIKSIFGHKKELQSTKEVLELAKEEVVEEVEPTKEEVVEEVESVEDLMQNDDNEYILTMDTDAKPKALNVLTMDDDVKPKEQILLTMDDVVKNKDENLLTLGDNPKVKKLSRRFR